MILCILDLFATAGANNYSVLFSLNTFSFNGIADSITLETDQHGCRNLILILISNLRVVDRTFLQRA